MSDIDIAAIVSVIGALVTVGGMFIQWRKSRSETKVLGSQEKSNLADAAETAAKALTDSLKHFLEERELLEKRIDDLEKAQDERDRMIRELQEHREQRDAQLAELKENNEALNARVAALNAQIMKDTIETKELREKYQQLKDFTHTLINALDKKGIKLPELNGKIPESLQGWQWEKKKKQSGS